MAFDTTEMRSTIRESVARQRDADGVRQMDYGQMMQSNSRLRAAGHTVEAATLYLAWVKAQGWV